MANDIKKPITNLSQELANASDLSKKAFGGIGGSGKHASELIAELDDIMKNPKFESVLTDLSKKAWGGIGGSGKHAIDLEAEITK